MIWLRSILFMFVFYGAMTLVGIFYLPLVFIDERHVWNAMRAWSNATMWGLRTICGVRIVYEGLEHVPQGAALFACKHQATLDTLLPAKFLREPVFVVKRELTKTPIFGIYMKLSMVSVDRGGHAKALKDMMRAAQRVLAKGRQLIIYPEGTRQDLGAQPDYKSGIAALYRGLNMPVVPIALNTGLVWPPKGILRRPGTVTIRVLPAIPAGLSREDFMRELEQRIESESEALLPPHLRRTMAA